MSDLWMLIPLHAEEGKAREARAKKKKCLDIEATHNTFTDIFTANTSHVTLPDFKQDRECNILHA